MARLALPRCGRTLCVALSAVLALALSAGEAIAAVNSVWAWGSNTWGQLGNPAITGESGAPVQVVGVDGHGVLSGVKMLATSFNASLALKSDGSVLAWGNTILLGTATKFPKTPVPVLGLGGQGTLTGVKAIATSWDLHLALMADGSVVGWGTNVLGEVGSRDPTPTDIYVETPERVRGVGGQGVNDHENSPASIMGIPHPWVTENRL